MNKKLTQRMFEAFQREIAFDGGRRISERQCDRVAGFRLAMVRAQHQANAYMRSLRAGKVSRRYRKEFVQAVRDCLMTAALYRREMQS